MIELQDWTMRVYIRDLRTKTGERILKTYVYKDKHEQWMREEVRDLQSGLYPTPKYRFEVDPTFVNVNSLMSGELVKIRTSDRGGPCDPSTERYWSM